MNKYTVVLMSAVTQYNHRINDKITVEADKYEKDYNFATFWKDGQIVLDVKINEVYYIELK